MSLELTCGAGNSAFHVLPFTAPQALSSATVAFPQLRMNNHDFSTPESAVITLELAYRARDIEAAVAAKDFREDARYFLGLTLGSGAPEEVDLNKWARTLEKSFRNQIAETGFRDYDGVKTHFLTKEVVSNDEVLLTQRLEGPRGKMEIRLLVVRTENGWRTVLAPGFDTL